MSENLLFILGAAILNAGALLEGWGALRGRPAPRACGLALVLLGWASLLGLVAWLWIAMGRPPIRTMGETRMVTAACLPAVALFARWRWKTDLLLIPMGLFVLLFLGLVLAHPEARSRALMPALQSAWFVPHTVAYMTSYATLALACAAAGILLFRKHALKRQDAEELLALPYRLLWLGFPLLTTGLVIGALWAKSAWGDYWTWDPKETWAFLTWAFYLIPLHQRMRKGAKASLWLPFLGFLIVLMCWFGVNALPTAAQSLHSYTN